MKRNVILFLLLSLSVYVQSFTLRGTITDETGEAVVGATIMLKGTSNGVLSDYDGRFIITLPDSTTNNILVFSYIGYTRQEYKVDKEKNDIVIVMKEDASILEEVVVMGYGTVKKSTITGSVSRVSASEALSADFSGINSGTLTAGEVNDFAKWDQWENILTKDFNSYLNSWKYRPLDRYMAQLTNKEGMPVVNAEVTLQNSFGTVLWKTRTDNTGKAELWANIFYLEGDIFSLEDEVSTESLKIKFEYGGLRTEVAQAVPFSQGMNMAQIDTECNSSRNGIDLFFVVDATGSMSDEIRYLQVELSDIIKRAKKQKPDFQIRIGSVVYRDKGDEYLTRKSSLDPDINTTIDFLKKQSAGGGGDYPEALDEALYQSIEGENWNNGALARIAFIVTDAPGHNTKESTARMAEQTRLAAEKGIRLVPIVCSGMQKDGEYLLRCLALATNGTYIFLTDDSGIGDSHLKPTTDKYDVEKLNDAIVRVIKQYTQMPDCNNAKWVKELKKANITDNFVPNPYDESDNEDVAKLKNKDVMKVYPNPCRDILKIDVKKEVEDVYFVDMAGKSLLKFKPKKDETIEADVQSLSSGVYFVKAFYKGKWFGEKVIVN